MRKKFPFYHTRARERELFAHGLYYCSGPLSFGNTIGTLYNRSAHKTNVAIEPCFEIICNDVVQSIASRSVARRPSARMRHAPAKTNKIQLAVCGLRFAGCRFRIAGCGLRVAGCGLRIAGCGLQVSDCGLWVAGCGLRVAGCGLRVAECLLPPNDLGIPGGEGSKRSKARKRIQTIQTCAKIATERHHVIISELSGLDF